MHLIKSKVNYQTAISHQAAISFSEVYTSNLLQNTFIMPYRGNSPHNGQMVKSQWRDR